MSNCHMTTALGFIGEGGIPNLAKNNVKARDWSLFSSLPTNLFRQDYPGVASVSIFLSSIPPVRKTKLWLSA